MYSNKMKQNRMRILSIILAASIAVSAVGCGKNTDVSAPSESPIVADETVTEEQENSVNVVETTEEASKKQAEEEEAAKKKAEEEEAAKKQAEEEEATKKAEEEAAKKKAEEEAAEKKKAEEEAAARKKAEEDKKHEEEMNSFSMMYYLAITAEEIRTSKDNRLILEDIYTSLLNDINPGAVDEITQDHLKNLRDIIKSYLSISTKRDRLQYIYNQNKAAAIRSAVPNPLAILSVTNAMDWKKLAVSVVYTAVDSYNSYKNASESADKEFLMAGWELDDEEVATVQKNRDRAFDYMVDMVQEYDLDGMMTLNEKAIEKFAEICTIESADEKIKRLLAEEDTYKLLGNYWLELADCYFETNQYSKCLDCVNKYNELSTGIYRKDFNYVTILPKAIVAAQNIYRGEKYNSVCAEYADAIVKNTSTEDWSTRYFAAEVYLDLYSKTNKKDYLKKAYKIASENVTVLLSEQRELNSTYLNEVVEVVAEEPDYKYMDEKEKKEKEKEYKAEVKRVKEYNKAQKELRKKELPSIYEPLVLNCELLFALSNEMNISKSEKDEIEAILKTSTNGIYIVKPINDAYSFSNRTSNYDVKFTGDEITIPVSLLTSGAEVYISVAEKSGAYTDFGVCNVTKVERSGKTIDNFSAIYSVNQLKKYDWTADSKVRIKIVYTDVYDKEITINQKVTLFEEHWYGDKVVFGK